MLPDEALLLTDLFYPFFFTPNPGKNGRKRKKTFGKKTTRFPYTPLLVMGERKKVRNVHNSINVPVYYVYDNGNITDVE